MTTTADLHAKAASAYDRISSDPRLTESAKRADLLRVWAELDRDLSALQVADAAAKAGRRRALEQQIFALPPTATSYDRLAHRDARQRADALEDEGSAARAMNSARIAGDMEVVHAIAARAVSEGWRNLASAYVAEIRPDAGDAIAELMNRDTRGMTAQFIDGANFYAAPPPGFPADAYRLRAEAAALDAADGVVRAPSADAAHTAQSPLEQLASMPREQVAHDELEQFARDLFTASNAESAPSADTAA